MAGVAPILPKKLVYIQMLTFNVEALGIPSLRSGPNSSTHGLWKSVFFIEKTAFFEPFGALGNASGIIFAFAIPKVVVSRRRQSSFPKTPEKS
jgi:hypothetical protein